MKKILTTLLALSFLLSATGCGSGDNSGDIPFVAGNVKVCTTNNLEKVLQNKAFDSGDLKLEIKAFQNEHEAAQVIMTPDYDVRSYTLTLSDLTCGENTLEKENFDLYHEKYIELERDVEGEKKHFYNGLSPYKDGDMSPDALLPMSVAIEYGENVIAKGNNQGIYVSVKIPKGQPAGVYTGNFTLNVDGNVTKIPVEVTVWGYEISDETHSRSTWAIMFDNNKYGEANLTKFMEKVYVDNLLDFRLNPQNVPVLLGDATNFKEAKIDEWLDSVVEYSQDPRCSYINIPTNAQNNVTVNGVVYSRLTNMDLYSKTLTAIAKRSLKEGINLFEKMDMWLNFLDESEQNGNVDNLEMSTLLMKEKQAEFATEWKAAVEAGTWFVEEGYSYDKDFANEVIESMRTLKQFVSDASDGVMRDGTRFEAGSEDLDVGLNHKDRDAYFNHPVSYLTRAQEFDYAYSREFFDDYEAWYNEYYQTDDAEQWLYTGCYPHYPYVNVLLDCDLMMQRATGWMMQQYDIDGMQMWYSNMYQDMEGYNTGMKPISDPYANASRFPETNGDGFTTYPGMPYGIIGPINTMRIHSLRDSMEDYEVLYLLEQEYKQVVEKAGLVYDRHNFEKMVGYINETFFEHNRIKAEADMNENFLTAREALVSLLDMVTKTETVITDYEKLADKAVLKFLSTQDTTLTLDGKAVSMETKEGYREFQADVDVTKLQSSALRITTAAETVDATITFGYYNETVGVDTVKNLVSLSEKDATAAVQDGVYRYTLKAAENEEKRYFDLDLSDCNINHLYGELWMTMYNYGETDVKLNLFASHSDDTKFKEFTSRYGIHGDKITSITLKPGENLIKIPTFILLWNMQKQRVHGRYDTLLTLRFETTSTEQVSLGLKDITIER